MELPTLIPTDLECRCTVPLLFATAPQNVGEPITAIRLKIPFLQGSNQHTERNNRGNIQLLSTRIQTIGCFNYVADQIPEQKYQQSRY